MRSARSAVFLVCTLFTCVSAWCDKSLISVRVIDGRNGKPIRNYRVYISFDGKLYQIDQMLPKNGTLAIDGTGHETMQISVVGAISCGEDMIGEPRKDYKLNQISESGYVSQNTCGQRLNKALPGEFVYYVRPATWWEMFKN